MIFDELALFVNGVKEGEAALVVMDVVNGLNGRKHSEVLVRIAIKLAEPFMFPTAHSDKGSALRE